jgi:hypothetical protein
MSSRTKTTRLSTATTAGVLRPERADRATRGKTVTAAAADSHSMIACRDTGRDRTPILSRRKTWSRM